MSNFINNASQLSASSISDLNGSMNSKKFEGFEYTIDILDTGGNDQYENLHGKVCLVPLEREKKSNKIPFV